MGVPCRRQCIRLSISTSEQFRIFSLAALYYYQFQPHASEWKRRKFEQVGSHNYERSVGHRRMNMFNNITRAVDMEEFTRRVPPINAVMRCNELAYPSAYKVISVNEHHIVITFRDGPLCPN